MSSSFSRDFGGFPTHLQEQPWRSEPRLPCLRVSETQEDLKPCWLGLRRKWEVESAIARDQDASRRLTKLRKNVSSLEQVLDHILLAIVLGSLKSSLLLRPNHLLGSGDEENVSDALREGRGRVEEGRAHVSDPFDSLLAESESDAALRGLEKRVIRGSVS